MAYSSQQVDQQEQELLSDLTYDAIDYMHGKGRDAIVDQLEASDNTADTLAAITYKVTKGVLEKRKEAGLNIEVGMDLALGVATEVIDMGFEILDVMDSLPPDEATQQVMREDVLLKTMMMHAEQMSDTPENKAEAEVLMSQFVQDGTAQTALDYVNKRADREGINVDDIMRAGNEMAMGEKNPVSAAVEAGTNMIATREALDAGAPLPPQNPEPPLMGG